MAPTAVVTHTLRYEALDWFGMPIVYPLGTDTVDFVNWQTTDTTQLAAIVYNPCGATRNLVANTPDQCQRRRRRERGGRRRARRQHPRSRSESAR